MAVSLPPLQRHLTTDKEVEETLCSKGLKVVELYSEWCGPCKSVIPTFKRIRLDKEDETTLLFLTNGTLKERVAGCNTPRINDLIMTLTPAMADADDLEENPLVQARRDREKKEKEAAKEAAREAAKRKK